VRVAARRADVGTEAPLQHEPGRARILRMTDQPAAIVTTGLTKR
jgi:hypothetical protein